MGSEMCIRDSHSLEATKLEIGCEGSVLLKSFDELGLLATPTWITHTWEFLSGKHMGIEDLVPELDLQREEDQYLMCFSEQGLKEESFVI